jgi:hypothetical protein
MDDNLTPDQPPAPAAPAQEKAPKPPRRFGVGLAIGIGAGILGVIVILAVGALIVYLTLIRPEIHAVYPDKVETVQLSGSWAKMTDADHGTVTGWSAGDMGSGSGMPSGAFADFSLSMPTEQDGLRATVSVDILVTEQTQLLMGGQPWKPKTAAGQSPIHSVFGTEMSYEDSGDFYSGDGQTDYLDSRQLTVKFHRDGQNIIADSIDASTEHTDPPFGGPWGF